MCSLCMANPWPAWRSTTTPSMIQLSQGAPACARLVLFCSWRLVRATKLRVMNQNRIEKEKHEFGSWGHLIACLKYVSEYTWLATCWHHANRAEAKDLIVATAAAAIIPASASFHLLRLITLMQTFLQHIQNTSQGAIFEPRIVSCECNRGLRSL